MGKVRELCWPGFTRELSNRTVGQSWELSWYRILEYLDSALEIGMMSCTGTGLEFMNVMWDLWSKILWKSQFSRSIADNHIYQLKRRPSEIKVSTEFVIIWTTDRSRPNRGPSSWLQEKQHQRWSTGLAACRKPDGAARRAQWLARLVSPERRGESPWGEERSIIDVRRENIDIAVRRKSEWNQVSPWG